LVNLTNTFSGYKSPSTGVEFAADGQAPIAFTDTTGEDPVRFDRMKASPHRPRVTARGLATPRLKLQPLPDLPPEDYELLKEDIALHGIQIPIIQDERGNTLDGHQRLRIATKLRPSNFPVKVMAGLTEQQKWQFALSVNVKRRHLSNAQKRDLVEQELKRTPDLSNQWLAQNLGVDIKTVQAARKRLEATLEIPLLTKLRGKDGRSRAAQYRQVLANTPRAVEIARQVVTALPPSSSGKLLDTTSAARYARRHARAKARSGKAPAKPLFDDSIRIHHCRFQELERVAALRPKAVSLIVTDIPYGKEFLPQIAGLGAFAARVLKEGGIFVAYSGQFHLPHVLNALGEHQTYRWVISSTWPGNANMVHQFNLASQFKPILVFSKGKWTRTDRWSDVSQIDSREKDWHDWQQSLAEVKTLVGYFSDPGDLVVDPCLGGGTTAVACCRLGRRCVGCDAI
jgi:ParB-like chromosome segregation protein Spo0J